MEMNHRTQLLGPFLALHYSSQLTGLDQPWGPEMNDAPERGLEGPTCQYSRRWLSCWLFCCCDKCHDQKKAGEKRVNWLKEIHLEGKPGWELRAGGWRQELSRGARLPGLLSETSWIRSRVDQDACSELNPQNPHPEEQLSHIVL